MLVYIAEIVLLLLTSAAAPSNNPWSSNYLSCEDAHIASKYVSNSQWFQVASMFRETRDCRLLPHCAYSERKNMSLVIGIDPIEARITDPASVPLSTGEQLPSASYAAECLPLADIVKATNSHTVDVLFLDAEGSEVAILSSYDFSLEPTIRVIVVEASDPRKYVELEQIFYRNGYVKTAVLGGDWVFAKLEDNVHGTTD